MADFKKFIPVLLKFEGGFVDDPDDPGGATNRGITMGTFVRYAASLLGVEPTLSNLKKLTEDQASMIYEAVYWKGIHGDEIDDQDVANLICDFYVNAGFKAIRVLQRALNAKRPGNSKLVVDGLFGKKTLAALNACDSIVIYCTYRRARKDYYRNLVKQRPELKKFLKGWLNRVDSFPIKAHVNE